MKPTCPECGKHDIHERNDCVATYPVTEVGEGEPTAYGEPTIHDSKVVDDLDRYQCWDCHADFDDFEHMTPEPEISA